MRENKRDFLLITIERTQLRQYNEAENKSTNMNKKGMKRTTKIKTNTNIKKKKKREYNNNSRQQKRQNQVSFVQMLNAKRKTKTKNQLKKKQPFEFCIVFRAFDSLMIIEC